MTVILVVVSGFSIFAQIYSSYQLAQQNRNSSIHYALNNLLPLLEDALWNYDQEQIEEISLAFLQNSHIEGVVIQNDSNEELINSGITLPIEPVDSEASLVAADNLSITSSADNAIGRLLVYQSKIFKDHAGAANLVGSITLFAPDHVLLELLSPVIKIILFIWLISLLSLAVFFFWMQQAVVVGPIKQLTSAIRNFSDFDQQKSVDDSRSLASRNDEIGDLFHSYFEMQDTLKKRDEEIKSYQINLEQQVQTRTQELKTANLELQKSLKELELTQQDLLESEKMASLGSLVSGVAHEVNTPLGISITSLSHLLHEAETIKTELESGQIKKSTLNHFINTTHEAGDISLKNLQRAAKFVKNFKEISVDQVYEQNRKINLGSYIEEIIASLSPKFKHTPITINTDLDQDIQLETYPGVFSQVLTNILINSLVHAFNSGKDEGLIEISLSRNESDIQLLVADNGKGMSTETLNRIFEPFYTTNRGKGNTGLGMHIVYNLVTQKLNGRIKCESTLNEGSTFEITFQS